MINDTQIPTIILQCITILGFIITSLSFYNNTKKMHSESEKNRIDLEKSKTEERIMMQNSINNITNELISIKKLLENTSELTHTLEFKIVDIENRLKQVEKNIDIHKK